jgi:DNA-binding transcriptional MerR regulator
VGSEDLMSIGMFSFHSGLSIPALRHYDEVGLLPPAFVDPQTGYRRYQWA